jgi:hypothetical protein
MARQGSLLALPSVAIAGLAIACASRTAPEQPAAVPPLNYEGADTLRSSSVAGGVTHHFVWDGRGPWAIHVLDVDRERCAPVVRAVKAGPPLSARATIRSLASGIAAMNADFFELPRGTPVGAHVSQGRVLIAPQNRPVFAVTAGGFAIGRAALNAFVAEGTDTFRLRQLNRRTAYSSAMFDSWSGETLTDSAARSIRVRVIALGRGVITGFALPGESSTLDSTSIVLTGTGAWGSRRAEGDTLVWSARVTAPDGETALETVGGFPLLIAGGRDVLAEQPDVRPSFGDQRHPRSAIGWNAGHLFWVLVDGRQPPYSAGMSLRELSDLFAQLGATNAINLDGGGSSALVVNGRVVNRPSDAQGERAVSNALVLEACRPPV